MSLYTTGFYIKRSLIFFAIFIGLLFSIQIITTITGKLTSTFQTVTPEQASRGFGDVTAPRIKSDPQASFFKPTNFSIETSNANLPDFSNRLKVQSNDPLLINLYKIILPPRQADSRVRGDNVSKALGFTGDPQTSDNVIYEWTDSTRKFTYYIDTKNFEMTSNNVTALDVKSTGQTTPDVAKSVFLELMTDAKITVDPSAEVRTQYVKYNTDDLSWETSPDTQPTNFIRVSLMKFSRSRGKDSIPLVQNPQVLDPKVVREYYPGYDYSPMYMIIQNKISMKVGDIVEIKYNDYNYDVTAPQTYAVKSVNDAFNEIKSGSISPILIRSANLSAISNEQLTAIKDVRIKSVDLGYYQSGVKTTYVLPIYVFVGEITISVEGTTINKGEVVYYVYGYNN